MKTEVVDFEHRYLSDLKHRINDYARCFNRTPIHISLTENHGTFYALVIFQY